MLSEIHQRHTPHLQYYIYYHPHIIHFRVDNVLFDCCIIQSSVVIMIWGIYNLVSIVWCHIVVYVYTLILYVLLHMLARLNSLCIFHFVVAMYITSFVLHLAAYMASSMLYIDIWLWHRFMFLMLSRSPNYSPVTYLAAMTRCATSYIELRRLNTDPYCRFLMIDLRSPLRLSPWYV